MATPNPFVSSDSFFPVENAERAEASTPNRQPPMQSETLRSCLGDLYLTPPARPLPYKIEELPTFSGEFHEKREEFLSKLELKADWYGSPKNELIRTYCPIFCEETPGIGFIREATKPITGIFRRI